MSAELVIQTEDYYHGFVPKVFTVLVLDITLKFDSIRFVYLAIIQLSSNFDVVIPLVSLLP